MAGEWRSCTLGKLTKNLDSIRVPVRDADRRSGPYPYYGASGIVDYVDDYLFDGEHLLIAEDGENLRTRNTLIAFLARGKFWVNNHAHIVRGNALADTRFLMYALAATDISGYLTGSTMPKLTQGNMNRIPILTPPLNEQRAVANILGTLDDKIELNRRMNETLEAMARAIFKSWFVDFDPVRAKAEGRTRDRKDAATALMFPAGFEKSSLGNIPQGWQAMTLGDLCDQCNGEIRTGPFGTTLHAEEYSTEGIPVVAVRDIASGYLAIDHQTPRVSSEVMARLDMFRIKEGDILFGRKGAVERSAYVSKSQAGWLMGSDCIRLRLPQCLCSIVWSFGFRTPSHVAWMQQHATGTTMASLNQSILRAVPLVLPTIPLLDQIAGPFRAIVKKMEANREEIATLAALRDALLPKLLSGEIRVGEAERIVERNSR